MFDTEDIMRGFFERMKWRLVRFMQGRYGTDRLSMHLVWFSLVLWAVSLFIIHPYYRLIPLGLYWLSIGYSLFRIFSRNIARRRAELDAYNKLLYKPTQFFKLQKNKRRDRKTHLYFKCNCGAVLRVPKGKGEIIVTCPKCGKRIDKKT